MAADVGTAISSALTAKDAPRTLESNSAITLALSALTLAVNLVTGVLIARLLGPIGRGQLSAVLVPPQLIGWVFATGCLQATAYHQARHPEDGRRLVGTWLFIMAPLSVIALTAGEAILPIVLAAQSQATVHLAQIFMLTVVAYLVSDLIFGVLLGDHDFLFVNLIRFAQPATTAVAYVVLWRLGSFTVGAALLAFAIPGLTGFAVAAGRAVRRLGVGRPDWTLAQQTLWYGFRAHGTKVSDIVNTRLDLLVIPAFLGATSVGLYAVATTVSGIVLTLSGALSLLVLPMAARQGRSGSETVIRLVRATSILAVVLSVTLGLFASIGVRLVYGPPFQAAVVIVWLLLPGTAMYAAADLLRQGLYAANRPLAATATYALGLLVTVPGLLIFLRTGGLVAAAIVSTASYATVFVATLFVYSRVTGVPVRRFAPDRSDAVWVALLLANLWCRAIRRPAWLRQPRTAREA